MLDEIDLRILDVLQQDGRITVLDLAEKVGLSPTPCGRRLRALEENGFIEKYVAILQPKKLGITFNAFVMIRLKSSRRESIDSFIHAVKEFPEVQEAYFITGDFDYLLRVRTRGVHAFKSFLIERLLTLSIAQTQSFIVLEQIKDSTSLPLSFSGSSSDFSN